MCEFHIGSMALSCKEWDELLGPLDFSCILRFPDECQYDLWMVRTSTPLKVFLLILLSWLMDLQIVNDMEVIED